jgi:hypothetical protein
MPYLQLGDPHRDLDAPSIRGWSELLLASNARRPRRDPEITGAGLA